MNLQIPVNKNAIATPIPTVNKSHFKFNSLKSLRVTRDITKNAKQKPKSGRKIASAMSLGKYCINENRVNPIINQIVKIKISLFSFSINNAFKSSITILKTFYSIDKVN